MEKMRLKGVKCAKIPPNLVAPDCVAVSEEIESREEMVAVTETGITQAKT